MNLAKENGCQAVAFPLISSGIYGYPKDQALKVAVDTISAFLLKNEMMVYIVIFDKKAYQISGKLFADIAAYIDDWYVDEHTDSRVEQRRRLEALSEESCFEAASAPLPSEVICKSCSSQSLEEALGQIDRFKFAEVRQEVIEMLKKDLLGPSSENEILNQNPRFEYIVGMLAPQTSENDSNEQEIDGDASFEGDVDYTAGEDDDNEPVFTNRFKTPSSIGISFYLESSTKSFNVDVTWGDYTKASDKTTNKEGKEVDVSTYKRHPQKETVVIDLQEFSKNKEYPLVCDSNVILYVSKIGLKQGYTLITAYVNNKRKNPESDIAGMMFQVNLRAYSQDKMDIFVAEHICRKILAVDEFYFAQRPILGRGRGCAATWKANKNGRASEIVSTFIPEYEFPGVSAALEGFDPFFFSMRTLSVAKKKDDIINRLNVLANSYEDWIQKKLIHDSKMDDAKFKKEIGDTVINKCIEALGRIRAGIQLLVEDDTAFDAFCFMNRSMILQRNIMNFSKKHGAGIECAFRDFVDPRDPSNNFGWRPFQIAFILIR